MAGVKKAPTTFDKLAADEVDIMRSMQVDEEQEMLRMLEIQQERFSRKRQAKESYMQYSGRGEDEREKGYALQSKRGQASLQ